MSESAGERFERLLGEGYWIIVQRPGSNEPETFMERELVRIAAADMVREERERLREALVETAEALEDTINQFLNDDEAVGWRGRITDRARRALTKAHAALEVSDE